MPTHMMNIYAKFHWTNGRTDGRTTRKNNALRLLYTWRRHIDLY